MEGGQFNDFEDKDHSKAWLSVFGLSAEANLPENAKVFMRMINQNFGFQRSEYDVNGAHADWTQYLTNGEVLESPFQDGTLYLWSGSWKYKPRSDSIWQLFHQ